MEMSANRCVPIPGGGEGREGSGEGSILTCREVGLRTGFLCAVSFRMGSTCSDS